MSRNDSPSTNVEQKFPLDPRERCPKCSSLLEVESTDPLEEFCIGVACDYYRARSGNRVIRE